jgi:hypothetical protein
MITINRKRIDSIRGIIERKLKFRQLAGRVIRSALTNWRSRASRLHFWRSAEAGQR